MKTFPRLYLLFTTKLGFDRTINEDSKLLELAGDSLGLMDIPFHIEKEFKIEISDRDFQNIETVGDLVRFIDTVNLFRGTTQSPNILRSSV